MSEFPIVMPAKKRINISLLRIKGFHYVSKKTKQLLSRSGKHAKERYPNNAYLAALEPSEHNLCNFYTHARDSI